MRFYAGLKKGRVVLALLFFVATLALFVDIYEYIGEATYSKILWLQFVPSLLNLDRKSTRLNSSHVRISYAVFCLKKKKNMTAVAGDHHLLDVHVLEVPTQPVRDCLLLLYLRG